MKQRRICLLIVVIVLSGGIWWFWKPVPPTTSPRRKTAVATTKVGSPKPNTPKNTSPDDLRDPRWKEWNEKEARDPSFQWKMPIEFYGKVADEQEQPVEGVTIDVSGTDLSTTGNFQRTLKSDEHGLFSLTGVKGKVISVRVHKDGYYTYANNRLAFEYAAFWQPYYHVPDSQNPIIFHLRKKGDGEPLIKRYSKISLPRDGSVVRFDLIEGKTSENGQLELQAWCSKKNAQGRFDWRLVLRTFDGGIKETNEEFAFLAPENGYLQTLEIEMPTSLGDKWKASVEKQVYVMFGTPPRYARLNFRMSGIGENFYTDYWLNPSGSRNLEFDPEKQINK